MGIHETLIQYPRDYPIPEERGVPRTAFAGCTRGKGRKCLLRLPGARSRREYGRRLGRFGGLCPGDPVEVVIYSVAVALGGIAAAVFMRRATSSFT